MENTKGGVKPAESLITVENGFDADKITMLDKYYPDFFLIDYEVYLEPKNPYLVKKDALKIAEASRRNSIRVIVLTEENLEWSKIQTLL